MEENYPSIVANVVRTGSKLVAGVRAEDVEVEDGDGAKKSCGLCGLPVPEGTDGIFGWGGDQNDDDVSVWRLEREESGGRGKEILCYGCSRSIHG